MSSSGTTAVVSPSSQAGELECTSTNSTELYKALEDSQWKKASERIKSHSEEAKTWIVRYKKAPHEDHVVWKVLPLHAAVLFSGPKWLILELLESYPLAVSQVDDQGMLPLHLAMKQEKKDEEVLKILLAHYPKAVLSKDECGKLPLEYAKSGHLSKSFLQLYSSSAEAEARTPLRGAGTKSFFPATTPQSVGPTVIPDDSNDTKAASNGKAAELKKVYEQRLLSVSQESTKQVAKLRKLHEDIQNNMKAFYIKELDELREQVAAPRKSSQEEIARLNQRVEKLETELSCSTEEQANLKQQLVKTLQDHGKLILLLEEQQSQLEAAQAMRQQFLSTMLHEEKKDSTVSEESNKKILELANKISMDMRLLNDGQN